MFNKRVATIIKRELKEKLFSKSFIIMTLLVPVFIFGILGFQVFLQTTNSDTGLELEIVGNSDKILDKINTELSDQAFIKNGFYKITYKKLAPDEFDGYLSSVKQDLLDEKINGVIYIPDSSLADKNIKYYSTYSKNFNMFSKMGKFINSAMMDIRFEGRDLSEDELKYARTSVDFNPYRITEDQIKKEGYGNQIVSFLLSFLLYMSLLILGQMTLRNVIQEKSNKVVEVLLSSADSKDLMTGKIAGTAITGIIQMIIWQTPLIFLITTSWFMLPEELVISIDISSVIFFLVTYSIGLITFLGLFAAAGAAVDNDQDAQSIMWPVMILIMIPFFIAISLQTNPQSMFGKVASLLPFASIIVMPVRSALTDVSRWELIGSVLVNVITLFYIVKLSGKIYRIGILTTGKKPKLKDIIGWLRES